MKRSWFPILLISVLLVLLGVLAFLQYYWLGQISDGERERLSRTVKSDTEHFAEDFNAEIQNAYFNFQINAEVWRKRNWKEFNERYDFYKRKTAYPELVKDFYFVEFGRNPTLTKYQKDTHEFSATEWNDELNKLKPKLAEDDLNPINEEIPALLMPIHELIEKFERIIVRTKNTEDIKGLPRTLPKKIGVLIIVLDKKVIENKIFPDLAKTYFSESESADYELAVVDKNNQAIFQTGKVGKPDASAKLFNLSPDKFIFYANRDIMPPPKAEKGRSVIFSQVQTKTNSKILSDKREEKFDVQVFSGEQNQADEKPRVRIFDGENLNAMGVWTLNVQHSAGSLEKFITNTRNKNLAISFGILSLLAVSIVLIFLSAQRAKLFAQRQVDFVSSVSHEFRTPLAVIYSAGENLSDGVIRDEGKIANYGNLIKGEGRKLSKMVEQILDFAGANSGKKKYDWRKTDVREIIENALAECQSLVAEKQIAVETDIADNLPEITADKNALTQAIQNLITNSVKYLNGEKVIKISAKNGGGKIKIVVEDKGIGIAKADLKHIFEPFYRAKAVVDEQIHGSGLGLSLVKQTVEAHGGKIFVESEIGKGSKFIIELLAIK